MVNPSEQRSLCLSIMWKDQQRKIKCQNNLAQVLTENGYWIIIGLNQKHIFLKRSGNVSIAKRTFPYFWNRGQADNPSTAPISKVVCLFIGTDWSIWSDQSLGFFRTYFFERKWKRFYYQMKTFPLFFGEEWKRFNFQKEELEQSWKKARKAYCTKDKKLS